MPTGDPVQPTETSEHQPGAPVREQWRQKIPDERLVPPQDIRTTSRPHAATDKNLWNARRCTVIDGEESKNTGERQRIW